MTTSRSGPSEETYVWIWLPEATEPVVAGKLSKDGEMLKFNYGKSYLQNKKAISLYDKELPLKQGLHDLQRGLAMPSCLRDASPDAWGRRVILNKKLGAKGAKADTADLDELTYLLESGSDRIGALDFQSSPTEYIPRSQDGTQLEELMEAAERVAQGRPLNEALARAIQQGTSIGGARPKALIESRNRKYIAKFSLQSDLYNVVKSEYVAMRLATKAGLQVAGVELTKVLGKDVLLIERFDRVQTDKGWQRKAMISALTIQLLDEMMARYASYEDLSEKIRLDFTQPRWTLHELFGRLVFNILCGNTDDHARNHAAFWDGRQLTLTPAYDICPQARVGREATQAMLIVGDDRRSRLRTCLDAVQNFHLKSGEAREIINSQVQCIKLHWSEICDEAELSAADRGLLWERQFLNPYAFDDLEIPL